MELAKITSNKFHSATGRGVVELFLTIDAGPTHPSWKPRSLGPLSCEEFKSYLKQQSTTQHHDVDLPFHFYHADLGPGNIMASEEGNVTGILY